MRWEEKKDGQGLFEQLRGPVEFSAKDEYIIVWRGGGRGRGEGNIHKIYQIKFHGGEREGEHGA